MDDDDPRSQRGRQLLGELGDVRRGTGAVEASEPVGSIWNDEDAYGVFNLSANRLSIVDIDGQAILRGTVGRSAGKRYFEIRVHAGIAAGETGLMQHDVPLESFGSGAYCEVNHMNSISCPTQSTPANGAWTGDVVVGMAVDIPNRQFWGHVNGLWIAFDPHQGDPGMPMCPWAGCSGTEIFKPFAAPGGPAGSQYNEMTANFGLEPFAYPVPNGFEAGW